jgi:hypothetical protein
LPFVCTDIQKEVHLHLLGKTRLLLGEVCTQRNDVVAKSVR